MKNIILMVDDNLEMRNLFAELLEKTPLRVVTFASVKEAQIHLLSENNRNDVLAIVSDLMMGPTDGLEFLAYVKKNNDLEHIDFFLLTGADISLYKSYIEPFPLTGIIEKPFSRKDMIATLTGLLANQLQATT
ncbi:MAG: hypothetical protein A2622_07395 [Bdellovibrionales bacterium RIFCSPHIGHO2_01_FULL_40_29]|nr:MAG: hypothetical protein A2622_07395 [Bdellovibrionales bacterium RIFCSPHIGHO2_01_FULL_40_29]OFZ34252.1 MAG: hypothetical protein A3D17_04255 [Bdellovibrionales bacterium RIFCSPHIGHO2_02_FULL_40_15]